jgi:phosphohistidine phosphatase
MKTLRLLRHAKSSWEDPGLADEDRPLAPRGRRATKALASYLWGDGAPPKIVLCSSARRARETLEGLADSLGEDVVVRVEPELYGAAGEDLLERLRALPDTADSVMLIGHNPAIQALALELARAGPTLDRIADKYPTGGLVKLEFEGTWAELGPGSAEPVDFVKPKDVG